VIRLLASTLTNLSFGGLRSNWRRTLVQSSSARLSNWEGLKVEGQGYSRDMSSSIDVHTRFVLEYEQEREGGAKYILRAPASPNTANTLGN
jgi:hypothetical protein